MAAPLPNPPTNFIVQQGNGQVLLSWNLQPSATNGFTIQRSTDGINYPISVSLIANTYLDTTVTRGTQYYYQVAAVNGAGTGQYTSPQTVTPVMQGELTLGQIRLMSQQRADLVNSQFITTAEWNTYINQSYFELYDILTTVYEDYYTAQAALFSFNGNSQFYPLPDGVTQYYNQSGSLYTPPPFYKLLGVDCGLASTTDAWVSLHKFDFISRNRYVFPNITSTFLGVFNLRYRLYGNQLMFIPTPAAAQWGRIWFIPRMNMLLQDTDIVDGVSGWTEYIVVDAAIKALQKEESDVTVLAAQKMALIDRINSTAMNRDAGEPDTISDTRSWSERWGGYGSPNGDGSFGGY